MSIFTPKRKSADKLIAGNAIRKMKYGPKKKETIIEIIETGRRDIILNTSVDLEELTEITGHYPDKRMAR